jgi:hypothetical protein
MEGINAGRWAILLPTSWFLNQSEAPTMVSDAAAPVAPSSNQGQLSSPT